LLNSHRALQNKIKAAGDPESLVEIAQQAGFSISVDDIKNGQSELSEEDLQGISGGMSY
jgi:predicted ribosomally synthesized peptide with nif11-like leader